MTNKELTLQNRRVIHVLLESLDYDFLLQGDITGNCIEFPTISIDANSDIRRTCNISLVVTDSSFSIQEGSKIWLNTYIRLSVGIEDSTEGGTVVTYYNQGIFLVNQPTLKYDATTNTLTFEGVDMMAKLTGLRNGYLEGIEYQIPADSSIDYVVRAVLEEAGMLKSNLPSPVITLREGETTTPNDLTFDVGSTAYDILTALRDIYSSYQIYFDISGGFHFEPIPTGNEDDVEIIADDEMWNNLMTSITEKVDFENVKNVIEVLGRTHDVSYYTDNVTVVKTSTVGEDFYTINAVFSSFPYPASSADAILLGITLPQNISNATYITLNCYITSTSGNHVTANIKDYTTGEYVKTLEKDEYLVFKFNNSETIFQYLGYLQSKAVVKDINPNSPYCINKPGIGEIRLVLSGGEYDNIYTNQLAQERAEYELYLHSNFQDSITIETVPIYYLDVNQIISFTIPDTLETNRYLIQSISTKETQTITASRIYPVDIAYLSVIYSEPEYPFDFGTDIDDLKDYLTVMLVYSDYSTVEVYDYDLYGAINTYQNTITVEYNGYEGTFVAEGAYYIYCLGNDYTDRTGGYSLAENYNYYSSSEYTGYNPDGFGTFTEYDTYIRMSSTVNTTAQTGKPVPLMTNNKVVVSNFSKLHCEYYGYSFVSSHPNKNRFNLGYNYSERKLENNNHAEWEDLYPATLDIDNPVCIFEKEINSPSSSSYSDYDAYIAVGIRPTTHTMAFDLKRAWLQPVQQSILSSIFIQGGDFYTQPQSSTTLTMIGYYSDGTKEILDNSEFSFTLSSQSLGTISSDGTFLAANVIMAGTITATGRGSYSSISDTINVKIMPETFNQVDNLNYKFNNINSLNLIFSNINGYDV